jgi:hypothetical protein
MVVFVTLLSSLFFLSAAASSHAPGGVPPQLAPSRFATEQYNLTFSVPHGGTYCPLAEYWVGSDHGTTIFLERPRQCFGAGYPSSSRGFEPENVARMDLYYSYWMAEDEPPDRPCHRVASVKFLGAKRSVCEERHGSIVIRSVKARYLADIEAKAVLRLITRRDRLGKDMRILEAAAMSFRSCKTIWPSPKGSIVAGRGALCSRSGRWF